MTTLTLNVALQILHATDRIGIWEDFCTYEFFYMLHQHLAHHQNVGRQ